MHVQLLSSDGLTREFKITVPANDLNAKKTDYIKSRAHKVKIDGFRPGKVPAHLLEQRLGGDAFNHALRTSIDQSIKTTAKDHNLQYINEPKVDFEEFEEGKDLSFKITFEVMPEIAAKDFSSIKLDKLVVDVSDSEVEKSLKDLHQNHTAFKPEEARAAKKGDRVSCDISFAQGGKKLAGYQNLSATVDVGAKTFILSDMDDQVLGAKEGETKTFSSAVADNFGDKKLAGKSVDVTLVVKSVLAPKTFKIDDEFAKEFGKDTLDALKQDVKEGLERNYTGIARLHLKRHLLDELEKIYDFPLPGSMVKSEFDAIWKHLQNEMEQARAAGENVDDEGKSDAELEADYKKIAERRVKLGLVISNIAQTEKIQLTQDELRNAIYREAMRYPGEERKVMEYYRNHPEMIDRLAAPMMEDKVVDFIAEKITAKEVKVDVAALKKKVKGIVPTAFDDEEATDTKATNEKAGAA